MASVFWKNIWKILTRVLPEGNKGEWRRTNKIRNPRSEFGGWRPGNAKRPLGEHAPNGRGSNKSDFGMRRKHPEQLPGHRPGLQRIDGPAVGQGGDLAQFTLLPAEATTADGQSGVKPPHSIETAASRPPHSDFPNKKGTPSGVPFPDQPIRARCTASRSSTW